MDLIKLLDVSNPKKLKHTVNTIIQLLADLEKNIDNIDLSDYQEKIDDTLGTTNKTIVGAINEVNEKAEQGSNTITDVQIEGTSIVNDGIVNITKGTHEELGLFKAGEGLGISATGKLQIKTVTVPQLTTRNKANTTQISQFNQRTALTLYRIDDALVKSITTNKNTLTDEQKTAAQAWLGISGGGKYYTHNIIFYVNCWDRIGWDEDNNPIYNDEILISYEVRVILTTSDSTKIEDYVELNKYIEDGQKAQRREIGYYDWEDVVIDWMYGEWTSMNGEDSYLKTEIYKVTDAVEEV